MGDYKDLIEMLRSMSKAIIQEDANYIGIPEENIWDADANALADAADVIEQLVNERKAFSCEFCNENNCGCKHCSNSDWCGKRDN